MKRKIFIAIYLLFLAACCFAQEEKKWYSVSKNDAWIMGLQVFSGYAKGWEHQVEFHHFELSQRFPGLFKNGNKFWDGRYDNDGIWDAKHMLVGLQIQANIACIVFKFGDLKSYPKNVRLMKILFDTAKFYAAHKAGFTLAYNVTHGNKIF